MSFSILKYKVKKNVKSVVKPINNLINETKSDSVLLILDISDFCLSFKLARKLTLSYAKYTGPVKGVYLLLGQRTTVTRAKKKIIRFFSRAFCKEILIDCFYKDKNDVVEYVTHFKNQKNKLQNTICDLTNTPDIVPPLK